MCWIPSCCVKEVEKRNMKFDFLIVLCIVLGVYNIANTVRLVANVLKGRQLLKKARENNEFIIKGNNAVYKASNYILAIGTEVLYLGLIFVLLKSYKAELFIALLVGTTVVTMAVDMFIHMIAVFKEKNVYLTKSGLIYFLGSFEFSKCRFSWENSSDHDMLSNTLHIYMPKDKLPFTVSFDNDVEAAHKITDENSI